MTDPVCVVLAMTFLPFFAIGPVDRPNYLYPGICARTCERSRPPVLERSKAIGERRHSLHVADMEVAGGGTYRFYTLFRRRVTAEPD